MKVGQIIFWTFCLFTVNRAFGQVLKQQDNIKFDDIRKLAWPKGFEIVNIRSSADGQGQMAYFHKSLASKRPLIVSLHTWSGNYQQKDDLALMCLQKNLNYIHPDFRGANNNPDACCSEHALSDIDDAITFAIQKGDVDTSNIYVMGVSGGGYATLCTFMRSRYHIKKFSAWASITDLGAWYWESFLMKDKYAANILACTGSIDSSLNVVDARKRSPLFMQTPTKRLKSTSLYIYAGIYDGIQGSVPITHSINLYNKILHDLGVTDSTRFVSEHEQLYLFECRRPIKDYGKVGNRKVCIQKQYDNVKLIIFEGDHEMLTAYALDEVLDAKQWVR